jgi:hypothetical protein
MQKSNFVKVLTNCPVHLLIYTEKLNEHKTICNKIGGHKETFLCGLSIFVDSIAS